MMALVAAAAVELGDEIYPRIYEDCVETAVNLLS